MPDTKEYAKAIGRLEEILANVDADVEIRNTIAARDDVMRKFQPLFSPERLGQLTASEFKELLLFKKNHHWTGLARMGGFITKDMDKLRSAIRELLDESVPVKDRIDSLLPDGKARIPRFGRAVITPILLISYPDRYGVLNNTAERGMKALDLWPSFDKRASVGERYAQINDLLLRLAKELNTDLWTLDALWYRAKQGDGGGPAERAWLVRAGREGEQEETALKYSVATILFEELPDLSTFRERDSIVAFYREQGQGLSEHQIANVATQAWTFGHEISEGDVVLLPLRTQDGMVAVGEVTGEYAYRDLPNGVRHTVPVEWLGVIERDKLNPDVAASLNAPKTVNPVKADGGVQNVLEVVEVVQMRNSAEVAKEVLEGFYPDRGGRHAVLMAFAESIRKAHTVSPRIYSVTLGRLRDRVRLNIASRQAMRLTKDTVDAVIDESRLREEARGRLEPFMDRTFDYKLSDDLIDLVIPYKEFGELYPLFREAHQTYIDYPARTTKVTNTFRAHSPGVLEYVRAELGQDIPDPELPGRLTPNPPVESDSFSKRTFELLDQLHRNQTAAFYSEHKQEFQEALIGPFRGLMRAVVDGLPEGMLSMLETEKRLFSRIPKNDYGKGGAWDYYWGAFYPKEGKRTEDAQLALWINRDRLEIGFFIGVYTSDALDRFVKNVTNHRERVEEVLQNALGEKDLVFRRRGNDAPDELGNASLTLQDMLRHPAEVNSVQVVLTREEILQKSSQELVDLVRQTFERYFPLVVLASLEDPLEHPVFDSSSGGGDVNEPYPLAQCAEETGFDESTLADWVAAIERKGQGIIYGPPGTGKTFLARRLAQHLIGGGYGITEVVQFHPAYAYEDFMQGLRPKRGATGGLEFELVPGRFLTFCREASGLDGRSVLIVDEINRANLSRVFGELMYLLEYRGEQVPLAAGGAFRIPRNVRLIGTMNTADRSIAVVDHALRRRFAFIPLYPDYEVLERHLADSAIDASELIRLLRRVNQRIGDPNYSVGVSFFLVDELEQHIEGIWKMEIEPYLEEYFFDQQQTVEEFRWKQIGKYLTKDMLDE